jgi:hypothetical protein
LGCFILFNINFIINKIVKEKKIKKILIGKESYNISKAICKCNSKLFNSVL